MQSQSPKDVTDNSEQQARKHKSTPLDPSRLEAVNSAQQYFLSPSMVQKRCSELIPKDLKKYVQSNSTSSDSDSKWSNEVKSTSSFVSVSPSVHDVNILPSVDRIPEKVSLKDALVQCGRDEWIKPKISSSSS